MSERSPVFIAVDSGSKNDFTQLGPQLKRGLSSLIVLQCLKSLMDEHLKLRVIVFGFAD